MQAYPPDYTIMMKDLLTACKDRRIRASSTHSIFSKPGYRVASGVRVCVIVGGMEIIISDTGVACTTHQLGTLTVLGSSLGDGGVWLRITAPACEFWLEINVPTLSNREMQTRA